ncbi:MAG: hypothetical protein HQL37_05330 [Alphaproteobacteria bacterium]|nr:hypothetical protein [Alphaproteobacteria bacterium]
MSEPTMVDVLRAIADLGQRMDGAVSELKAGQAELRAGQAELRTGQDALRTGQDALREELKAEIRHVSDRLIRVEARLEDMPTARHFGAIEGRLDEMSRHLNSALVYVSPPPKRGHGS